MCLKNKLRELIDAGFAGLWVQTQEPDEAIAEIRQLAATENWHLATWDCDRGLAMPGQGAASEDSPDPIAAIRALTALGSEGERGILVLANFHRFLQSPETIQAVFRAIQDGKKNQRHIVIVSNVVQIPTELERVIRIVEHDLPSRDELEEVIRQTATEDGEIPEGPQFEQIMDAMAGLTKGECESVTALSLVRHGRLVPDVIWELKAEALKKNGTLTLHRGKERFEDLGGLEALKSFAARCLAPGRPVHPKGILLLGVPGTGKSAFAKALGNETARPTIALDMGALMGSLVGQSEERTRAALQVIDAMAPACLYIDELEKAFAGTGTESSGVTTRMFGTFLSWLNDHTSDIFVVCTSNDIAKLPPEFARAERFDAVFFLDLPTAEQRDAIWAIYQARYGISEQSRPEAENWTGAEIQSCCRLAALLDVPLTESASYVVPVAATAADRVEGLRQWASGRVLDADRKGIYQRVRQTAEPARRAVARRKTDLE